MMGFDLLRPELLWLPPLALLLLAVGWWGWRKRGRELSLLVGERQLARFVRGHSRGRSLMRVFLATGAFGMTALAALGPVRGYTEQEVARQGLDLVVCIDTSRSMLAEDLRPSRLERAKREVLGLLDRLRNDRCALIAFSGDARDVAPLTHDRRTLASLLKYVSPEDNRRGGTDLAAAIDRALELFDGRTGAHEAICLLTDGEDLEGRTSEVVARARERGIRIFVVGIGTEGGGKIPIATAGGGQAFLLGPDGNEVVSRLDTQSLARIAESTGGDFLSAERSPTPLEDLYEHRIARLEGRELESGLRRVPHDRFQWPLFLALACMLGEGGLRERRRAPKEPR